MKKQITIKDLALKLNIHHTTVSRALRNHPDINEKTRNIVLEAASKYNYVPNSFAKNLRNAKSKTIVVLVPEIKGFFFSEVMGIISNLAFEKGYSVMIYQSNEEVNMELQNLKAIKENRVAGVIASVANVQKNEDEFSHIESLGIPVVLFDRFYKNDDFSKVIVNNFKGAYDATEYLINKGKENIAFYHGPKGNPVFVERQKGYLEAMKKHDLYVPEDLMFDGGITIEDGEQLIKSIAQKKLNVDAILCSVDMVALGVMLGCRELDIDIPNELALIGFDNEPAGRIIRPALTTVAQPVFNISREAFKLLLSKIEGDESNKEILLPMELIKRTSA